MCVFVYEGVCVCLCQTRTIRRVLPFSFGMCLIATYMRQTPELWLEQVMRRESNDSVGTSDVRIPE